ncbi:MAG TPA: tetratricopeptide repeat protein [Candidatus Obscuribacter sp.]|nr:tetratricopeptide repeat protein [Candidatus Obscuribacter sp.]
MSLQGLKAIFLLFWLASMPLAVLAQGMSVDEIQRFAASLRAPARSKNSAAVLSSIKSYRQKAAKPTEYFFVEVQDKLAFEGDFRSALAVVDDGLTVYPTSYRLYEARGNIFLSTFELDEARKNMDKALSMAPNNPSVLYHMGLLELAAERFPSALKYVDRAIAIKDEPTGLFQRDRGRILRALKRYGEAEQAFRKAIAMCPANQSWELIIIRDNLARTLVSHGQFEEAIKEYLLNTKSGGKGNADRYYQVGQCYLSLYKPSEALKNYLAALKLAPDRREVHQGLSQAYEALGDKNSAARHKGIVSRMDEELAPGRSFSSGK